MNFPQEINDLNDEILDLKQRLYNLEELLGLHKPVVSRNISDFTIVPLHNKRNTQ